VENLLKSGHDVTIANRGLAPDDFGNQVNRIVLERTSSKSVSEVFFDKHYDIVYDSLAFSSNDVKCLLDVLKCDKYIMTSSVSVYENYQANMTESDFVPENHPLKWCWRADDTYNEVKRQAECALYQCYSHIPSIAVRFPFVVGEDDYTRRLHFYVEHVAKSLPIFVDNLDEQMSFITSEEAGRFLAWLCETDFCGKINASAYGTVSICDIIEYIEKKTRGLVVYSESGVFAPYNGANTHSMILQKAEDLGFKFSAVDSWIYGLLDRVIEGCK